MTRSHAYSQYQAAAGIARAQVAGVFTPNAGSWSIPTCLMAQTDRKHERPRRQVTSP